MGLLDTAGRRFNFLSLYPTEDQDVFRSVFFALMSDNAEDLDEAVELVNENAGRWPDDFRYELEGLQSFREFYGRRVGDYTLEQREMLKAYDENWTEDLVRKLLDYEPVPPEQVESRELNIQ